MKDEQKILKIALDSGIANYFISCPINERESNIKKALYAIDYLNDKAKELIIETDIPYIVNRGRKGGSNVAAAIVNALLYGME